MKALTICQPYAELIARGEKTIENRTWATAYRGRLLIHAGKSRAWLDTFDESTYPEMVFGAAVALCRLVECVRLQDLPRGRRDDPHANGPWCWILEDIVRLSDPEPMRGAQGLWEADFVAPPEDQ